MVEVRLAAVDEVLEGEREKGSDEERPRLRDLFPRTSGEIRVLLS
jgi:DNA-directed RNA polymerase subunit F